MNLERSLGSLNGYPIILEWVDLTRLRRSQSNEIRVRVFPEIEVVDIRGRDRFPLDITQERVAKNLPYGHYMVTGIPGSGKSVILLGRAIYLATMFRDWKILILTYNRTLKHRLEIMLNEK